MKKNQDKDEQRLYLTGFKVLNKHVFPDQNNTDSLLKKSIQYTQELIIPPGINLFSFNFAKVDFLNNKQTNYRYKLEGLNNNWIETDSEVAEAVYSLLPSGNYTFKVKISDDNGQWKNENTLLSVDINVLPPWWHTWWAYCFYLSGIFYFFWLFYRTKLAEKERQTTLELVNAKEQLFANISHEFRTPLTLILGPAKVIKNSSNDNNTQHNAHLIERNALRLLSMVDQLLQLAQIKAVKKESVATHNVAIICDFVFQTFVVIAKEKQITLTMPSIIDDSWWVSAQQNALETILYNLLTNAIKFTQEKGSIELTVTEKDQWLEFKVTDSGCGIAEHNQSKIFDRFTRIENDNYYVPGAGIGLALVQELVKLLGGKIKVNSRFNEGSSFIVSLAKAKASTCNSFTSSIDSQNNQQRKQLTTEILSLTNTSNEDKHSHKERHLSIDVNMEDTEKYGAKPSILIVDDNQEMRNFIKLILTDSYLVIEAENGQQALNEALKHSPDIIITDVMMPIMNGFELLCSIRNEMAISHTPVILLTAKDDQQSKLKGLSDLADDYISKPFDGQELLIRIQRLIGLRSILQKRFSPTNITEAINSNVSELSEPTMAVEKSNTLSIVEQQFIQRFKELIEQGYHQHELTLPMISVQLSMSDRQLQRKLKAISGSSFSEMLREYRLTQAQKLLNNGEQIAVIADRVGFSSSSYFVRCFKAKYGKSPNDYRKAS